MQYGTVVQYFSAKGFGFIRPQSGPDVFFHATALGGCEQQPQIEPGQAVKYELEPGTQPRSRGRRRSSDEDGLKPERPARPQARLVELIERIPGAILSDAGQQLQTARHPRARKKKPLWRR